MIPELIQKLWDNGLEVDDLGVLDALWIAEIIPPKSAPEQAETAKATDEAKESKTETPKPKPAPRRQKKKILPPKPPVPPPDPPPVDQKPGTSDRIADRDKNADEQAIYTPQPGRPTDRRKTGTPFRVPSASALPNSLDIGRALRVLKRDVPLAGPPQIDEDATATRSAELEILFPVMRSDSQRWLEAAVVIDGAPEMAPWRDTIDELLKLLQRHGAFRDVRAWTLDQDARLHSGIAPGTFEDEGAPFSALVDPRGRRLILLATLGQGAMWENGKLAQWLRDLSEKTPVALLLLLPPHLWNRTAVGYPRRWVKSIRPGSLNPSLHAREEILVETDYGFDLELAAAPGLAVPIMALTPETMLNYARMLAGADSLVPALAVDDLPVPEPPAAPVEGECQDTKAIVASEPKPFAPAADRIAAFRTWASPEAFQLIHSLAGVPLMLPVIRIVQKSAFARPTVTALAEILASDLVIPTEFDGEYDFAPGVREALLLNTPRSFTRSIMTTVSAFATEQFGATRGFQALIEDPEGKHPLPEAAARFTAINATIRNLFQPDRRRKVFVSGPAIEFRLMRIDVNALIDRTPGFVSTGYEQLSEELKDARRDVRRPALLEAVKASDIFLLLLGKEAINFGIEEVNAAIAHNKPIIALCFEVDRQRHASVEKILIQLQATNAVITTFASLNELIVLLPTLLRSPRTPLYPDTIEFPEAKIVSLAWASSGRLFAAGGDGLGMWSPSESKQWIPSSGKTKAVLPYDSEVLYGNGKELALFSSDFSGLKNGQLADQETVIIDIAASDLNQNWIAAVSTTSLYFCNVNHKIQVLRYDPLQNIGCCEFNSSWGDVGLIGRTDGCLVALSEMQTTPLRIIEHDSWQIHDSAINDLASSRKTDLIASASTDRTVGLFRATEQDKSCTYLGHPDPVVAIAFNPAETLLATLTTAGKISIFDITSHPRLTQQHQIDPGTFYGSLAFHPTRNLLAAAAGDSQQVHLVRLSNVTSPVSIKNYYFLCDRDNWPEAANFCRRLAIQTGSTWRAGPAPQSFDGLDGYVAFMSVSGSTNTVEQASQTMPAVGLELGGPSDTFAKHAPKATFINRESPTLIDDIIAILSPALDPSRPITRVYFTRRPDPSIEWRQLEFLLTRRGFTGFDPSEEQPAFDADDLLVEIRTNSETGDSPATPPPPHLRALRITLSDPSDSGRSSHEIEPLEPQSFATVMAVNLLAAQHETLTIGNLRQRLADYATRYDHLFGSNGGKQMETLTSMLEVAFADAPFPSGNPVPPDQVVAYNEWTMDDFALTLLEKGVATIGGYEASHLFIMGLSLALVHIRTTPSAEKSPLPNSISVHRSLELSATWDHIPTIYSPEGLISLIKRRDGRPALEAPRRRIALVGTALIAAKDLRSLCSSLGKCLARQGYDIVIGTAVGVDSWVREGFTKELKALGLNEQRLVSSKSLEFAQKSDYEYVTSADAAIFIQGRGWTRRAWAAARDAGKLVIPIPSTKGDSAHAYKNTPVPHLADDINADPAIVSEAWSTLNDTDDVDATIAAIMALLELASPSPVQADQEEAKPFLEVPDFLRPYEVDEYGFLSEPGVLQFVADNLEFITDEGIQRLLFSNSTLQKESGTLKALLLFKTPTQRTWLVASPTQLAFVLDDQKTRFRSNIIQEVLALEDVHLQFRRSKDGAPAASFRSHSTKAWLYSEDLFPNQSDLSQSFRNLLTTAAADKGTRPNNIIQVLEIPDEMRSYEFDSAGFLTEEGVLLFIADNLNLLSATLRLASSADRLLHLRMSANPPRALLLFQNATQRVWLVRSPPRLYVVFDNERTRANSSMIHQSYDLWAIDIKFHSSSDGARAIAFSRLGERLVFSPHLFPSQNDLLTALERITKPKPATYAEISEWVQFEFGDKLIIHPYAEIGLQRAVYKDLALVLELLRILASESSSGNLLKNAELMSKLKELDVRLEALYQRSPSERIFPVPYPPASSRHRDVEYVLTKGRFRDPRNNLRIYFFREEVDQAIIVAWLPSDVHHAPKNLTL